MPSMFGGDQCGKEYAPHMWIGDNFIGGTSKNIETEDSDIGYHAGVTAGEVLIVELVNMKTRPWTKTLVPNNEIPQKIRDQFSKNSFQERKDLEENLEKMFNRK